MFKRHVYTCPDIIYLHKRQKKITVAYLATTALLYGALWVYSGVVQRRENNTPATPETTSL